MSAATWVLVLALVLFAVVYPTVGAVMWPSFVRDVRAGKPRARLNAYIEVHVVQWSLASLVVASWCWDGRSLQALGLGAPGVGGWIGLAVVAALAMLVVVQLRGLDPDDPKVREAVEGGLGETLLLLPRDATENRWFRGVAVTAGVCEEIIYRGAITSLFAAVLPLWAAIAATTIAFGLAHAYQGARSVVKVTIVGGLLAGVAWLTDSLWPAIALHALIDLQGGFVGYAVMRRLPNAA